MMGQSANSSEQHFISNDENNNKNRMAMKYSKFILK